MRVPTRCKEPRCKIPKPTGVPLTRPKGRQTSTTSLVRTGVPPDTARRRRFSMDSNSHPKSMVGTVPPAQQEISETHVDFDGVRDGADVVVERLCTPVVE